MSKTADATVVHRKVAALGFRGVGKSSLINSFVSGTFSEGYDPTIESTHHKTIRFRKVHFATDIVDTAGMVRSHTPATPIRPVAIRALVVVQVVDLTVITFLHTAIAG